MAAGAKLRWPPSNAPVQKSDEETRRPYLQSRHNITLTFRCRVVIGVS